MKSNGEGRVTCRTGENEMWRNVTRVHRTTAQTITCTGNAARKKQNVHMRVSKTAR